MPTYQADDGTTIVWGETGGPATVTTPDGATLEVPFAALAAFFDVERAALIKHLSAKDHAANLWAHELKGGLQALTGTVGLLLRYAERGDLERVLEKAEQLRRIACQRRDTIEHGRRAVLDA